MTSDIRKVQTHAENQRLFGIIVTSSHANDGEMTCYVFENFESANEICCTFDTAKAIHQSKVSFFINMLDLNNINLKYDDL